MTNRLLVALAFFGVSYFGFRHLPFPGAGGERATAPTIDMLRAVDSAGSETPLIKRGSLNVILVASRLCAVCDRALPAWRKFLPQLSTRGVRVLAVAWADEADSATWSYLRSSGIAASTAVIDPDDLKAAVGVDMTPSVIVVDHSGKVVFVGRGLPQSTDGLRAYMELDELRDSAPPSMR
ncbi:hypothetical protein [Gemmatimonas sp.]|uniref:TlpA family protein disulfide reductase n=1 Tax=Gemmatimonas sp. TaxID=1962908 RepID=UPI0033426E14